jgi:hypothetical protein
MFEAAFELFENVMLVTYPATSGQLLGPDAKQATASSSSSNTSTCLNLRGISCW